MAQGGSTVPLAPELDANLKSANAQWNVSQPAPNMIGKSNQSNQKVVIVILSGLFTSKPPSWTPPGRADGG
jgi:hypothetical protein